MKNDKKKSGALNLFTERTCKICNKTIITLHPSVWAYKILNKNRQGYEWYCSYNCFRKAEKEYGTKGLYKPKRKKSM